MGKKISVFAALIILVVCTYTISVQAQAKNGNQPLAPAAFKVVGYLREADIANGNAARFNFSKLTHLNIAFLNPDSSGTFSTFQGLRDIVTMAHASHVQVLASIGGGSAPEYYTALIAGKDSRNKLIDNIVALTKQYKLDGIDVDLEGHFIDSNYEALVVGMSNALKPRKKMLTAAVATVYATQYTDKALAEFDFINIMSYDKTGPWKPENPGPHAPYAMAVEDLDYWLNTRGIAKEKLTLGLPFYGYGFGNGVPADIAFKDIVTTYPAYINKDEITVAEGGTLYYNGLTTIKNKTLLAIQRAGGIMVWQLLQDDTGQNSLLNTIVTQISAAKK